MGAPAQVRRSPTSHPALPQLPHTQHGLCSPHVHATARPTACRCVPPPVCVADGWIPRRRDPALPKLPIVDDMALEQADLDLEPLPRLELAWEAGPEPEPAYASVATTPRTMSRAPSPPRSVPSSRPVSAGAR